jgi:uncharacterized membrane protein
MSGIGETVVAGFFAFAAAIWVGGFIAIGVVARAAAPTIGPADRVAFFRALGRSYGVVGGVALVVALGTGAVLLSGRPWDAALISTVAVAAALVLATVTGVLQARRMTVLREAALQQRDDAQLGGRVVRDARRATALRSVIGLLTLALVALGAVLAT